MAEGSGAPIEAREAFETLVHLARGKTGRIPPELLARHVIVCYAEADWPVQRAALEALLRRIEFGRHDGLRVTGRPGPRAVLGSYGAPPRPARGGGAGGPPPPAVAWDPVRPRLGRGDWPERVRLVREATAAARAPE